MLPGFDKLLIGMTKEEAIQTVSGVSIEKMLARVVEEDGKGLVMTMEYRSNRINLTIKNGIVIKTSRG